MSIQSLIDCVKRKSCYLLSELEVSQEDYDALINYTRKRIVSIDSSIPPTEDIKLALTLVQVAIRKYNEGNYWSYFKEEVDDLPQYKQTYIGKSFLRTVEKYNLFFIKSSENGNAQYVENIKAHAFVPNNYLNGYFDFLFSFYEGNLLRVISDDLTDDLIPMQSFMKNSLSSSNDNVILDNSDFHNTKTYRLLKATRNVFANIPPQDLLKIIFPHLKMLDRFYYDGIKPSSSDRFCIGFLYWAGDFENDYKESSTRRALRKRGPINHKPYFKLINETVYLIIPPQKFREEEFGGIVNLFINGEKIKTLDIYNRWGIKVSEEEIISINSIFDSFDIRLVSSTEKKYYITDQNYRLFNEDWEEISKPKRDTNYIIFKNDIDIDANNLKAISYPFPDMDDWRICQADFYEDTIVFIDGIQIKLERTFTGKTDLEQYSTKRYYIENENGERIHTVYRHIVVSFVTKIDVFEKTILHCNDEHFSLNIPGTTETFEIPNDNSLIGVEIDLNNILISCDGIYNIWIDEPGRKNRPLISYLLLTDLRCSPEKPRYFFKEYAKIKSNNNYSLTPLNCTIDADGKYLLNLHDYKIGEFSICVDSINYHVFVPIRVVEFCINDNWFWTKPNYIWINDFSNTMLVKLPGAIQCGAYLDNRPEDVSALGILNNGIFELNMTDIRNKVLSSEYDKHELHIVFQDTQPHDKPVFRILKSLWFNKFECINLNGVFTIDVNFDGNANCFIDVYNKKGELLVENSQITNGFNQLPELNINEVYDINRRVTEPDDFGFDEVEICSWQMKNIGIVSSLENCNISITRVIFQGSELEFNRKFTIKNIKKKDDESFIGVLYEKQYGRCKEHILFPKILFKIIDENKNLLNLFIEEGEDWVEPIYDKLNKRLITEDMIYSKDYNNFEPLFENDTTYTFKKWRSI